MADPDFVANPNPTPVPDTEGSPIGNSGWPQAKAAATQTQPSYDEGADYVANPNPPPVPTAEGTPIGNSGWPRAYAMQEEARRQGYNWSEIDQHLAQVRDTASSWGHDEAAVDAHLGFQDNAATGEQIANHFITDMTLNPEQLDDVAKPNTPITLASGNTMDQYVSALRAGTVKSPEDFSQLMATAWGNARNVVSPAPGGSDTAPGGLSDQIQANLDLAKQQLAGALPDQKEISDSAIGVAGIAGITASPESYNIIRDNLMQNWVENREKPMAAYTRALGDMQFAGTLTTELKPPEDEWNHVIRIAQAAGLGATMVGQDLAGQLHEGDEVTGKMMRYVNDELGAGNPEAAAINFTIGAGAFAAGNLDTLAHMMAAYPIAGIAGGLQLISEMSDASGGGVGGRAHQEPSTSATGAADLFNLWGAMIPELGRIHAETSAGVAANVFAEADRLAKTSPSWGGEIPEFARPNFASLRLNQWPEGAVGNAARLISQVIADQSGELKPSLTNNPTLEDGGTSFRMEMPVRPAVQYSIKAESGGEPILDTEGQPTGRYYPQEHIVSDQTGVPLVRAYLTKENGVANVESIRAMNPETWDRASNTIGPRMMRDIARQYLTENPDVQEIGGWRVTGARTAEVGQEGAAKMSVTREQVMGRPVEVLEQAGASPAEAVNEAVHEAFGNQLHDMNLKDRIGRLTQLEDENRSENSVGGDFFQRLLEKQGGSPEAVELAKGYDAATGLRQMFSALISDDSGTLDLANIPGLGALAARMHAKYAQSTYAELRDGAQAALRSRAQMRTAAMQQGMNTLDGLLKAPGYKSALQEWQHQITLGVGGNLIADPYHQMLRYAEGRSQIPLSPNSPLYPIANTLRSLINGVRGQLKATNRLNYSTRSFDRLFQNPASVPRAFGGMNAYLRRANQSTPLTFTEGVERHLIPATEDGVGSLVKWLQGASYEVMHAQGYEDMKALGPSLGIKGVVHSPANLDGYERLNGIAGNAQAPAGLARTWNAWVSQGVYGEGWGPTAKGFYAGLRMMNNVATGLKLALPAYHALAISNEIAVASIANGLGEVLGGEFARGIADITKGAMVFPAVVSTYREGRAFQDKYMTQNFAGDPLARMFAQAGGYGGRRQAEYTWGTAEQNTANVIGQKSTSLGARWMGVVKGSPFGETGATTAKMFFPRLLGATIETTGRVVQSLTATNFVFDRLIPFAKQAAWSNEMQTFMRQNPTATQDAVMSRARMLVDSMDNRFGELNQNNIFWNAAYKQILNSSLLSFGWEYGSMRAFGNAIGWDIDRMQRAYNPVATRWAIAFGAGVALQNSVYQYIKTGTLPMQTDTPLKDFMAPRAGGVTPGGLPSRVMLPGYQKDAFNWYHDLVMGNYPENSPFFMANALTTRAKSKLNPLLQIVASTGGAGYGPAWWNLPFEHHMQGSTGTIIQDRLNSWVNNVLGPGVTPIFMEKFNHQFTGTGVRPIEGMAGVNNAPLWLSDPVHFKQSQDRYNKMMFNQANGWARGQNRAYGEQMYDTAATGGSRTRYTPQATPHQMRNATRRQQQQEGVE